MTQPRHAASVQPFMRTLVALAAALFAVSAFADARVTHNFTSSMPLGSVRRVVIDIDAGDIKVRNGAAGTVTVTGRVRRETDDDDHVRDQRIVDDSTAAIYLSRDEAVVRRKFGPNAQGWRAQTHNMQWDVTIEVPAGVSVDVGTHYGDVALDGTFGNIDVDLRAGDIDLTTPRAAVRELTASVRIGEVHTHLGDEIIEREGVFPGKTHWINKAATGTSIVNIHATAGDVSVVLTR